MSKIQSLIFRDATSSRHKIHRHLTIFFISIAAILSNSEALAQNNTASGASSVKIGESYAALKLSEPLTALGLFNHQHQASVIGLAIGSYVDSQNYGFELGYTDYGSVGRNGGSTKIKGLNLSLLGRMPLNSSFNLLGKLGTTYSRTQVSTDSDHSSLAGSDESFHWSYGVGAEFKLNSQFGLALEYDEVYVNLPSTGRERVYSTTAGLRYYY